MNIDRCCNQYCYHTFGGPHWGNIIVIDELDFECVYACEAHADAWMGNEAKYNEPPPGCTTIREDDEPEE